MKNSHKVVLAASSPYFSECFDDAFLKSGQDRIDLTDNTNMTVLTSILDYMYSGSISFQIEDGAILMATLNFFKMQSVKYLCEVYLVNNINAENYVALFNLADEVPLKSLKEATLQYINKNFREIHGSDEFKKLTKVQWLVNSFLDHLESPFRPHPTLHILSTLDNSNYIWDVRDKSLIKRESCPKLNGGAMVRHRKSIYAFGEAYENQIERIGLKYDVTANEWTRVFAGNILIMPWSGTCSNGDGIYLIGGLENKQPQRACVLYDVVTNQGTILPDMKYARAAPGVVTCKSSIYVFGGYQLNSGGTRVERYDPREGKWFDQSYVKLDWRVSSAVISEYNVYCLERNSGNIINFDTRSSRCTNVTSKWGSSLASLDGRLYVSHTNGIAEYNPFATEWNEILQKSLWSPVLIA